MSDFRGCEGSQCGAPRRMQWLLLWNRTHRMVVVVVVVCRPRMKSSGTDTELRNSVGWRYVNKMGSHSSAGCFCCSAAAAIGVVCCCGCCCCNFRLNERFVFVRESFTLLFGGEDETVALFILEESDCDNDCCCCCGCERRGLELLLIVRMGLGRGVNCRVAVDGCGGSKLDSTSSSSSSSE